tara:strand:- start:983 stop:1237 length:255 start_codon:yes stop_codon:yes gene_type:complete
MNYWKQKQKEELAMGWLVVAKDMDGLTSYLVCHALDAPDVRTGSYWSGVTRGSSLNKQEMQDLADELNAKNEPAADNIFRGAFR